ncbi:unnamed protein product [Prorocentrum cordatum]|uniref:Nuclear pore complex protein Nup85 n=1 Tax=Prorocentrum cordatum TaxID=2364126 RepID=A0ABN9UVJ5_9DINO|nr:unnamed protein product [Polarella glacialis]
MESAAKEQADLLALFVSAGEGAAMCGDEAQKLVSKHMGQAVKSIAEVALKELSSSASSQPAAPATKVVKLLTFISYAVKHVGGWFDHSVHMQIGAMANSVRLVHPKDEDIVDWSVWLIALSAPEAFEALWQEILGERCDELLASAVVRATASLACDARRPSHMQPSDLARRMLLVAQQPPTRPRVLARRFHYLGKFLVGIRGAAGEEAVAREADEFMQLVQRALVAYRDEDWETVGKKLLAVSARLWGLCGHICLLKRREFAMDKYWLMALLHDISKPSFGVPR